MRVETQTHRIWLIIKKKLDMELIICKVRKYQIKDAASEIACKGKNKHSTEMGKDVK